MFRVSLLRGLSLVVFWWCSDCCGGVGGVLFTLSS